LCVVVASLVGLTAARAGDCDAETARLHTERARNAASVSEALEWLDRSLDACRAFPTLFLKAKLLTEEGRLDEALAVAKEAREVAPDARAVSLAQGWSGVIQARRGELCDALTALQEARHDLGDDAPTWLAEAQRELDVKLADQTLPADTIDCVLAGRSLLAARRLMPVSRSVQLRIQFAFDSAEIDPEGLRQLNELATALSNQDLQDKRVHIIGHTDTQGSADYNQGLSERRARSVQQALVSRNASLAGALDSSGMGEREPLYPGDTEEVHLLNRRVEVKLDPGKP
jgi:outer membrane protein OmpA-like peptidoglycan-associated protein